jgi:hypothetical protein
MLKVSEALGLDRWETDAFLKGSQGFRPWEPEEFADDLAALGKISN